jgi:glycosyltransferase involved in cell wall biosynthesis
MSNSNLQKQRITIVMPVHNGAMYLKETIDNVLLQTYADFIFLIFNDGSTDETEQIILSYADNRIQYMKNDYNMGLVKTLNRGIDLVKTEFLARIDADDLWHPKKLEKQLELMDIHPEVGICGTSIRKFGAYESDLYFPVNNSGLKVGFLFYCCMSHPSVLFRMSFLKSIGIRYREDYFPAEDYKMWVDCLNYTQIYNIPEILVYYRQHDSQITQDSNCAQIRLTNQVRLELLEELSSGFTKEEKDFHINKFLKSEFNSVKAIKLHDNWTKKLLHINNKARAFDAIELRKSLIKHVNAGYYMYLKRSYFSENYISGIINIVFSCVWLYLKPKYILKLVFNK